METVILSVAAAFGLLCLWLIARRDWTRLISPSSRVSAVVTGYRTSWSDSIRTHAPVYRFTAEGAEHDVTDQLYSPRQHPPVGTVVELRFPQGRPDLARPPRLLMWLAVYGVLLWMTAMVVAKLIERA